MRESIMFIASFHRPAALEAATGTPAIDLKTPKRPQDNHEKTARKPQEKAPLQYLQQQPSSGVRALAEALGMSYTNARHHLLRLQAENKPRRIGPDKGGYWEVIAQ